jgi:ferredoxin-thioredoxin reductase catalytic subunit
MKKNIFYVLVVLFFLSSNVSIEAKADESINQGCQFGTDNIQSDGTCFCDAIIMYHSYLHYTGDRSVSITAAVEYLNECED